MGSSDRSEKRKYTDYELIFEYFRRSKYDIDKSTMVDVGAQIGLWSKNYVRMGWQVVAFEPEESNFEILQRNIDNSKGNFDARNLAISDIEDDGRKFYFSQERIGIHSLEPNHVDLNPERFQIVRVSTLDRQLEGYLDGKELRLLKLDIEGAELHALKGFTFSKYKPELIIGEFGLRSLSFGNTFRDIAKYGVAQSYRCILSHKQNLATNILWLGDYDSPRCADVPDNAWGELIFVRPDVYDRFISCLDCFDLPFEVDIHQYLNEQ